MEQTTTQQPAALSAEPQQQHQWLQRLIGEWSYETGAPAQPDQPQETFTGTETVRALGDIWVVAEGRGTHPGGGEAVTMMTLGYDPEKQRFVGTWVGSMLSYLWVYEGELDSGGRVLTLRCDGPRMDGAGTTKYEDIIELEDDDHRVLRARMLAPDGEWQDLMKVRYRRAR